MGANGSNLSKMDEGDKAPVDLFAIKRKAYNL